MAIAALAAAGAAWLGYDFWVQAVLIAAVATTGVLLVKRFRGKGGPASRQALDVGQSVTLESWISEADGLARVNYRNAQWEAQVEFAGLEDKIKDVTPFFTTEIIDEVNKFDREAIAKRAKEMKI